MTYAHGARWSRAVPTLRDAALFGALSSAMLACSSAPSGSPAPQPTPCALGTAQPKSGDTLAVATMAAVDWSHVPAPANDDERLAFSQLYETLIDVDCEGRARPGLAASWTLDPTKTRLTLSLRRDAIFWSGKPLTAEDVLAAWRRTAEQPASSARLAGAIASATTIIDDHTMIVSLPDTAWMVLSSSTLAVYEQQATARWPEGSGPYRIVEQSAQGRFVLMPIAAPSAPYLASRPVPTRDPRDAIDAGSDVLVTDDPVAVDYAKARASLMAVPLPWTRTYALAVPGGAPDGLSVLLRADSESVAMRGSLAHDAVHAEARAAEPPYWWHHVHPCTATLESRPLAHGANEHASRIVYRRDDAIARGLAERLLVVLTPHSVAAGLAPDDFTRALHDGGDLAYVIELPRVSLSSCNDLAGLWAAAPWLANGVAADSALVPLIDTRETAIVKRDRVSATVDWNGTLHFSRP